MVMFSNTNTASLIFEMPL